MATWMVSTMMTVLWAAAVIISAQPPCDPLTQYELSGQCCQMCPPGTSMSQLGTCKAPHCLQCDQDEYQDTYTTETKCKRQPYCDPNKNFQFAEQTSKTEESICMCKLGFHCSSDVCLTCVPHRPCEPGWGAIIKGNQTHDTVCHKCPEGSFSNQTSWHSDCLTWTKCKSGYVVRQSGSAQSDVVCDCCSSGVPLEGANIPSWDTYHTENRCSKRENQRTHVIIACVSILGMGILLAAAVKIWSSRRRREDIKGKDDEDPPKEALIAFDGVHEEPMSPGAQVSLADSSGTGEPEENEDRPSQVALLSDKGNYVTQENGKAEVLSRQESQSMTGTSEMSC